MKKFLNFAGLKFLPIIINLYMRSLRIKTFNAPDEDKKAVYIFWHSAMLAGWWILRNRNPSAMVSQSRDGEILSNILKRWGYEVIRGSSSKGNKEALYKIIDSAKQNRSIVITPDGPRGPANVIKNGALIVSKEAGIPVIPVKIIYRNKYVLSGSWDKFEIPLPFSICEITFGREYYYKVFLNEPELAAFKNVLNAEMS